MKKIFWLAGEKSGDLHAAAALEFCQQQHPDWYHFGIGGKLMQKAGLEPLFEFSRFNVMGFAEVVRHLGFFLSVEKKITAVLRIQKPDAVVLVDYPGLNLRIARRAKKLGIKVLYYICPQFWAWKKKRIYKLAEYSTSIGYILPFEGNYFKAAGIEAFYTGHPIAEEFQTTTTRSEMAQALELDPDHKWISLFPGSRNSEIKKLLPVYLQAITKLKNKNLSFLISKADSIDHELFAKILNKYPDPRIRIVEEFNYEMMLHSHFLCVKSGTTTLETAYAGTPFIICYRTSNISYFLGRLLVNIKWIGLPNIILQDSVIPELIQKQASPEGIAKQIEHYLASENDYLKMRAKLLKVHNLLGKKSASREVTALLEELVL